ncbi:MAG: single-stranded-DNA-specific exonuclease RecJ [Alphaproteobacteria bacterium]|nr:single-stranded-DNA-specific exonuclease RecJ [Alphaproteobacteria bacterium]
MDSLSLNKAAWVYPDADISLVEKIVRQHDLPEVIARMLVQRGVNADEIDAFLNPTLKDHMPDPLSLADMKAAAEFIAQAIQDKKQFAIFGDFDVDGATSSALLYRFLKYCAIEAPIYIPGRLTEGYGPNTDALVQLKEQGAEIVFLLDCGTTSFDVVAAGAEMGLDIIIVDHHEAEDRLPDAKFVINPKRKDDVSGLDVLAAVGVTFMVCVAVNAALREKGFFEGKAAPIINWLDIIALGTVCDMVPLLDVNRLLVRQGFKVMQNSENTGLQALIEVSGIKGELTPYHAGFVLGPRINAGSRVHKSDLGAKLLSGDDPGECKDIAWLLNDCNDKRKAIQTEMEREAINMVEDFGLDQHPMIFVASENFHQGLSGLVAGRLKEKYGKPACVVSCTENGAGEIEGRGSGRSIPGIHVAQAFIDARNEGIILKGGGHAMAGGFTVAEDQVEAFKAFLYQHIEKQMQSGEANIKTDIDGIVTVRGAKPDLVKLLQNYIGPFGQEHPEPLFLFQNVRIHSADVVGEAHIRTLISDWEGGSRMKAMAFRSVGTELGEALLKQGREPFDILGTLKIDNWGGQEKVEIHIKDAAFSSAMDEEKLAEKAALL